MTAVTVNTVLGPIAPADLGFTLMHEHVMVAASGLYQSYPDLLGHGPEARAIECLRRAKAGGVDTLLDATTFDLGRHAPLLAAVSKASGVNIINVTGWWLDVPRFLRGVGPNQMAREFVRDIREGFRGTDIKAGMLSLNSPVARALIGKFAGDVAEVQTPGGRREYEILDVKYI